MTAVVERLPSVRQAGGAAIGGRQRRLEALAGYGFVAPAALLILLINAGPLAVVLLLSATDYTLAATSLRFVGLENYGAMIEDPVFWRAIRNSILYVAIVVPGATALGLAVALLVHSRRRSRRFYETVYFLPVTGTLVAMAIVWQYLMHGRIGPINALLTKIGLDRIDFLTDPSYAMVSIAAIGVWQLLGFNMILFLAGLTAIPQDLYDAAALDGIDSGWDRFVRITCPLLGPTMIFVTVTTSITAFQLFDTVAVLTKGGPMGSTDVLLYKIYLEGFQYFEMGYAAALTVVFLVCIVAISLLQIRFFDKRVHYGG